MNKNKKKNLSPQDKLMIAVYGKLPEEMTPEEREQWREKIYEMQANSVTDEEFEKMNGCTVKESTDRAMRFAGWCDAVVNWQREHADERKYHVFEDKPVFTVKQVIDMAQMFYQQGRDDATANVDEYDRLWKLNRMKG